MLLKEEFIEETFLSKTYLRSYIEGFDCGSN